jgi:S-formylglutathione hydrolase FrmB
VVQPLSTETPDAPLEQPSPLLYLLHGLSDDHTIWMRRTSIERYAAALGLTVVMPAVQRSFYTDMAFGYPFWTFISEELPTLVQELLPVTRDPAKTFVAGLSMGGYGAFKLALRHPERFGAAASLSGVLDFAGRVEAGDPERAHDVMLVVGETHRARGSENDLLALMDRLTDAGIPIPPLYQCCGTEDVLYEDNLRFRDQALEQGMPLTYEEHAGMSHDWAYWDQQIQRVLAWLPLAD